MAAKMAARQKSSRSLGLELEEDRQHHWLASIRGEPRFKKLMERVKREGEEFEV